MPEGKPPKPQPPKNKEIGQSDLSMGGVINPDEYNADLKGTRRIREYDKMRLGDAHVGSSLKVVKLPLLSATWDIQSASESQLDLKVAEHVRKALFTDPTRTWQETLTNILLYLDYGVMPFEIVYKFDNEGLVTLKKLAMRHPRTITRWELKNGDNGIEQTTTDGVFEIPMDKLCIFVNEKEGDNWEGKSILRNAWKHWQFKDKAELIEMLSMQKQGLGVPRGKTPTGATSEDEAKMDSLLGNMRANEKGYIRHPADWEVEFMNMGAGTIKNPSDFIKRQEWAIMLNVLATFMQMGSGAVGSFALYKGSNTFFLMALEYVAKHITETLNKYVIKKIVDYNFIVEDYPTLTYDSIGDVDVNALTTALQRAIQTGSLTVDGNLEDYLRKVMDLPEFTGETLVDPTMADAILAELDAEVAGLTGDDQTEEEAPEEDPDNPGFDLNGDPIEASEPTDDEINKAFEDWNNKVKKAEYIKIYGSDVWDIMKTITAGGTKGEGTRKPLSEETKKKISEALKRSKSTATKGKKGKKKVDPAVTKKKAEIKAIREEARQFARDTRRELLQMRAKGKKLDSKEKAKKELEIFNKKEGFSDKIAKLQSEIDDIKAKTASSHDHGHTHKATAAPSKLIDIYEEIESQLETLTTDDQPNED